MIQSNVYKIHKAITVCDVHCDTVDRLMKGADLGTKSVKGQIDIPRLIEGSVELQVFACCIDNRENHLNFTRYWQRKS